MTNLTPTPAIGANIPVPDDGEDITAVAQGASKGDVRRAYQELTNRSAWLIPRGAQAENTPHARPYLLSFDGTTVTVGPLAVLFGAAHVALSKATETTISVANLVPAAGNWPADSWVFIFAYNNNGTLSFEARTTPPTADLVSMTGDATRKFLGAFRTVAVNVIPFRGSPSAGYRFDEPQTIFSGQTQTAWTTSSLGARVPASAMFAQVLLTGANSSATSSHTASLRPKGSGVTGVVMTTPLSFVIDLVPTYGVGRASYAGDLGMNPAREIEYQTAHANHSLSLSVTGWRE